MFSARRADSLWSTRKVVVHALGFAAFSLVSVYFCTVLFHRGQKNIEK